MPQEGNTRVMEQFDTLDVSAVLNLESALVRDGASRQVLPAAVPLIRDCKMKAKEKYQSDVWLEIEHLNKGIVREDPRSSSVAPCDTTTSAVAQCETDPVENILDQNLKIKFYISSGSASPSSHSGDEADPVKIVDSAHLPVHTPTIKRKEYHSSILFPTKNKSHQFFLTSFTAPTKCHQCTSLMVGLIRQGCACDACGFSCHTTCVEKAPRACPVPSQQKRGTLCVDVQEGMGTAYEGHVWIPKKAGVKKGWQRALAIVCDFKLFLYNMEEEKGSKPNVVVSQVIDMRDGAFSVSSVWPSDFIPVRRKEMSRMFKVTASQLSAPSNRYSVPILADSENDKCEWVGVLSDLHRMLRKSHSRDRSVYVLKEAYDSSLPLIKTTQTAAIIDHKRIALGNEEGLFVVHVTIDEIIQVGDMKKIYQIELIPHGQMVAVISGRSHHVQLFPMLALDGRKTDIHKLAETKGCHTMTSGTVCQGAHTCLCVARKSQVFCYELFQSKKISHRKFKELQIPANVQWMAIFSEQLCVGFQSGFLRYPLRREGSPYRMLHSHDPTLSFIVHQPVDALCAIEISSIEYLLCFKSIGIYTDSRGLRSRPTELMWPATPTYCRYNAPYLSVYSENAVDIFDVNSMEWIQTVPLKKMEMSWYFPKHQRVIRSKWSDTSTASDDIPSEFPEGRRGCP
ncbi:serine/threonine-protein kinase MRCK alpha-like isoform X3 [Canis lupus familiaris]|uniref:serine/threonine-protein kinase MRCK alpha-like isoform X3 n=1 Tax=Canis lupus familiaris TaxID=9615 RepID=UPI0003AD8546|nr:serine/threonine-protein kinase MRCK alpha-like isoform X3 [Canis lupus familiaris]XP_038383213.1 serine/threonine-protein kinase MRCK alpha-like isoform X3 [Canis lupus familiaris]|eukprot:XP_005616006.1 serine/threonine-protein kinase MRCK alpha-like isoform X3 [Canis lupus familiaris]